VLSSETLFSGQLVRIADFTCRARQSPCGAEEYASSHHLVFTRSGVFVKHAGRRQVVAEPAHVLFFNRHEPFRVSHPASRGDDCTIVAFAGEALTEALDAYEPGVGERPDAPFSLSHALLPAQGLVAYRKLRRDVRTRAVDTLEVEERALGVLHLILREAYGAREVHWHQRANTARTRRELAESARLLLATRPSTSASLAALARAVNSSPFHLSRVFRREVGVPIHQYVIRLRLARALESLAESSVSLSGLALAVGFANHSHFTAMFTRTFGMSPSAFRCTTSTRRLGQLRRSLELCCIRE
jgi:AraC family transcriptional regulator